eukprot:scaffold578_cov243-Pinguiococcus_pyrenoidosus.AAC.8
MDKLVPECTPLKAQYDGCMSKWYRSRFLKGTLSGVEDCWPLLEVYQDCVEVRHSPRNFHGNNDAEQEGCPR